MITTQTIASSPAAPSLAGPSETQLDRMVDKVLEMGMNGIAVTKDTLYEFSDFSRAEIDAHAADACDIARQRANRAA